MSLLLLIDGYNVIPPVAPPGRGADPNWLQRERMQFIQRLCHHLQESLRRRTCIVFDAADPPRDRPSRFSVDELRVVFAVGYAEADDLLEEIIADHSAPKQLAVVSSDRRVQAAANRRGATAYDSQDWLDQLLDGRVQVAPSQQAKVRREGKGSGQDSDAKPDIDREDPKSGFGDTEQWLRDFGF
ncbi:MAG: NYN domain-containing protein [Planctomycetota bacterium]